MDTEERLNQLGLTLPAASNPAANYGNCILTGSLLYVSGKGPTAVGGAVPKGKLGRNYSVDQGYEFARQTGLDILAVVKQHVGSLDRVTRVVKLQGFINATEEFEEHPLVLDGCSDLMVEIFGERGVHARSAFGAASLRDNLPIIIDSIFEIDEKRDNVRI